MVATMILAAGITAELLSFLLVKERVALAEAKAERKKSGLQLDVVAVLLPFGIEKVLLFMLASIFQVIALVGTVAFMFVLPALSVPWLLSVVLFALSIMTYSLLEQFNWVSWRIVDGILSIGLYLGIYLTIA